MSIKTVSKKKKQKKEVFENNIFKMYEIITPEEKAIMYGVANNKEFDKKDINNQLVKDRELK